jgi:hypothetical protein
MNSNKEIWKDEVINSLNGLQSAEPSPFFVPKTIQRIRDFKNDLSPEIRFRFNVAALTLSFLLIINILVLFKSQSNKKYADSKISLLNNLELYE